jgi:hypothetical protein
MGYKRLVLALVSLCVAASILLAGCGEGSNESLRNVAGTWDVVLADGSKAVFKLTQSGEHVTGVASVSDGSDSGGAYALTGTYALMGMVKGNTIALTAQSERLHAPTFTGIIRGHEISGHMVEGHREGRWSATRRLAPRYPYEA